MSLLSGWCTAPPGAKPPCEQCRYPGCPHECHQKKRKVRRPKKGASRATGTA